MEALRQIAKMLQAIVDLCVGLFRSPSSTCVCCVSQMLLAIKTALHTALRYLAQMYFHQFSRHLATHLALQHTQAWSEIVSGEAARQRAGTDARQVQLLHFIA